jgi:hypothetical protein
MIAEKATTEELREDLLELVKGVPDNSYIWVGTYREDVPSGGPGPSKFFEASQVEDAIACIQQYSQNDNWGVFLRQSILTAIPSKGRGTEDATLGTNRITADLDVYKAGKTKEACIRYLLNTFEYPPTVILDSGGGVQPRWYLNEFCTNIDTLRSIGTAFRDLLKEWGSDNTFDLARVLRVPDTYNNKRINELNEHRRVHNVHKNLSVEYDIESLPRAQVKVAFEYEFGEPEALDEVKFLAQLERADYGVLRDKILSEKTARARGAVLNADGDGVCRYMNDLDIVRGLLALGFSAEVCYWVLTHPKWFSGHKHRQRRNDSKYVEDTIKYALQERSPQEASAYFISARELRKEIGQIKWDWYGWIIKDALNAIIAPMESGKSFVALGLAKTMIEAESLWPDGTPYEGRVGKALWLETEVGWQGNLERMEKAKMNDDNVIFNRVNDIGTSLFDPVVRNFIGIELAKGCYSIFVVDALSGTYGGKVSENETKVGEITRWLAQMALTHHVTTLLVHHTNKPDPRNPVPYLTLDRARGASSIMQPARSVMVIERERASSDGIFRVEKANFVDKNKYKLAVHFSAGLPTYSPAGGEQVDEKKHDTLEEEKAALLDMLSDGKVHASKELAADLAEGFGTSEAKFHRVRAECKSIKREPGEVIS